MKNKRNCNEPSGVSCFQRLSAGSVEEEVAHLLFKSNKGADFSGYSAEDKGVERNCEIWDLERAVDATFESARTIDGVRRAFEDVLNQNQLAAKVSVADLDAVSGYPDFFHSKRLTAGQPQPARIKESARAEKR